MKLIIAEKPSIGRAIAGHFGVTTERKTHIECQNGYVVTWLFGHVLKQFDPEEYTSDWKSWQCPLPMRPQVYKNKIQDSDSIKFQVGAINQLLKNSSQVINAGDPDREGQLLVDELLDYLQNNKPVLRIMLAAVDEKSIEAAFKNIQMNEKFVGLKYAAETRQRADWLIGMNFTRAFTNKFQEKGYRGVISVGRVQTPTLKLIVDRDNEIKKFKPKDFYELSAGFNNQVPLIKSKLIVPDFIQQLLDEDGRLLDKSPLEEIAKHIVNQPAKVGSYSKQSKTTRQPLLFNLSELQSVSNRKFGYSAQTVLDVAQILYENKLTSYPRTDCQYLPESQFNGSSSIISSLLALSEYSKLTPSATIKSQAWNDSKVTAHHGIVPTGADLTNLASVFTKAGKNKEAAENIFHLICLQYLAQFYPPLKYDQVDIYFEVGEYVNQENSIKMPYQFKSTGKTIIDYGWKSIFSNDEPDDEADAPEDDQLLPILVNGQVLTCTETKLITKQTQKPKPYTEGTIIKTMANIYNKIPELVKSMGYDQAKTVRLIQEFRSILKETAGLGTEATRAKILETLKEREFIKLSGKNLSATALGHAVINAICDVNLRDELSFLASPLTTAEYEQYFDEIQNTGTQDAVDKFWYKFDPQLNKISGFYKLPIQVQMKAGSIACPICEKKSIQAPLKCITGKNGKFWACQVCSSKFSDLDGVPVLTTEKVEAKLTGGKCPECDSDLVEKVSKFGPFISCSNFPKCKWTPPKPEKSASESNPTGEKCPECKSDLVEKTGPYGKYISCSGFPKCKWKPSKPKPQASGERCPKCGSAMVIRKSKKGEFLGCSAYPRCEHKEW